MLAPSREARNIPKEQKTIWKRKQGDFKVK